MRATRLRRGWVHTFITHCLQLNLQLDTIDLVRTCRIISFCTVAWQLARFQLTRSIARSLGDSWGSCPKNKCNFLHKNKLDIVRLVQFLTGRRPMRSFSPWAVATIALWKSAPMSSAMSLFDKLHNILSVVLSEQIHFLYSEIKRNVCQNRKVFLPHVWKCLSISAAIHHTLTDELHNLFIGLEVYCVPSNVTIRYDTRCYFNVRSKADMSRLNLLHGDDN